MSNNVPLGLTRRVVRISPEDPLQDTVCFLEVPTCLFPSFTWQFLLEEIKEVNSFLVQVGKVILAWHHRDGNHETLGRTVRLKNCPHRVHTSMFQFILICTRIYTILYSSMVCPGMYKYIPVRTSTVFILSVFPMPWDNGGHTTMYFSGKAYYSTARLKP